MAVVCAVKAEDLFFFLRVTLSLLETDGKTHLTPPIPVLLCLFLTGQKIRIFLKITASGNRKAVYVQVQKAGV
jgi:hypothetical protein